MEYQLENLNEVLKSIAINRKIQYNNINIKNIAKFKRRTKNNTGY